MNEGSFVLKLSKALWDKAAAKNGNSSSTAAPKRKKKSTYSSDDCVTCGSIALAGQEQCISCTTGVKGSGNAVRGTGTSSGWSSSGVIIPAAPKIMPRFSLSSGGKIPNIVTTRRLQPSECSQLIEREILYVKSLQQRLSRSALHLPVSITDGEEQLTCLGSMTYEEIAQHLISLRVEPMQRLFRPVLAKIMQHPRNLQGVFNRPVDTSQEGLKTYGEKIAVPMDLGTIRGKLQRGQFESLPISVGEMRLVFQNAMEFNPVGHTIHTIAKSLLTELESEIASLEEKCVKDTEKKISHSSSCRLCGGEQCNICGEKCIKFESSVLLCHGPCMGRVKRNSVYYVSRDGMMLWCQRCFSGLSQCVVEGVPNSDPPRPPVMKRSLLKCKSDEEVSEPWVECDYCHKWVHQVCALYNDRYEEEEPMQGDGDVDIVSDESPPRYECPRCKLESKAMECIRQQQEEEQRGLAGTLRRGKKRIQPENDDAPDSDPKASLGTEAEMESEVNSVAIKEERKRTRDLGIEDTTDKDDDSSKSAGSPSPSAPSLNPKFDLHIDTKFGMHLKSLHSTESTRAASTHRQWNARDLPRSRLSDFIESMVNHQLEITGYGHVIPSITIRMTSNIEQYVEVPEPLVENLMNADGTVLPKFLDYKQKCILLFQKIEGVDVCLFSLYVQEFGNACPAPNTNCVYISYLDSVDYLRPVEARTMVYHEIMVAYLKWVQLRGFKQAHIWACPPQRGDNFIFWCHPSHQRTPSRERLTNWYEAMLERATLLGVVEDTANLFDNYFQPYLKKERVLLEARAAAKNSFVGAGRVVKPGVVSTFAATLQAQQQAADEAREARESGEQNAPVCPPIFEGDFWVNEYLRLHRASVTRITTEDGHDRDLNRRKGREWLKLLMTMQTGATFSKPVDPEALNLREYRNIISKPMDLGTVRENLRLLKYEDMLALAQDIRLTFLNAMTFNPPSHYIHQAAAKLLDTFNNMCVSTVKQYSNGGVDDDDTLALEDADAKLASYPLGAAATAQTKRPPSGSKKSLRAVDNSETMGGDEASTYGGSSYGGGSPRAAGGSATGSTRVSFIPGDEESEVNVEADDRSSSVPMEVHDDGSGERMSSHASVDSHSQSHGDDASREEGEGEEEEDGTRDRDRDGMDDASISGSEQPDFAPPLLRRQDSLESCVSTTLTDDCNPILSRRPFHSGAMSGQIGQRAASQRFIRAAMGTKAAFNTMGELAQGVDRLKSDLFVVFFTSPNATEEDRSAAVARREAKQVGDAMVTAEIEESERAAKETSFKRNKKTRVLQKPKLASNVVKRTMQSAGSAIVQSDTCINEASLELAYGLVPDTSDPDANVASPFVDSRHTFLEMCQFRHYQFDTLRRAKHSSQMALFHLHNPYGANTRPTCVVCRGVIRDVRWHCSDGCADSDTCQDCYIGAEHCDPSHKLTPFRVTFM